MGHQCKVHTDAILDGPLFIGNYSIVGRDAQLMAGAVIGEGCIIGDRASVRSSLILHRTYIGQDTEISDSIAAGGLINVMKIGQWVRVPDEFILSAVHKGWGPAAGVDPARSDPAPGRQPQKEDCHK